MGAGGESLFDQSAALFGVRKEWGCCQAQHRVRTKLRRQRARPIDQPRCGRLGEKQQQA